MCKIAICDDEPAICGQLEQWLLELPPTQYPNLEIEVYDSGVSLLGALTDGEQFDLIFLDIGMGEINGFEVGRILRGQLEDEGTHLVYMTGDEGYMREAFQTRPMQFLVKPLTKEQITENLRTSIALRRKNTRCFVYVWKRTMHKIPFGEILYFESRGRKIRIFTRTGQVEYNGKLADAGKQLPSDDFLTLHVSYLANYEYIQESHKDYVIMKDGKRLPISRNHEKAVQSQLLERRRG